MKDIIAIITARGGSKRIPQKNIKDFYGKPMLSYAIDACKEANIFNEIMVSTDSQEIMAIAKKYGAQVPFLRSENTANDFATTADVLCEVLENYKLYGMNYNYLCCVYPCVPFLTGKTLREAYSQFISSNVNALQPVCRYPVPIEWAMKIENGLLVPDNPASINIRSQDLISRYFDAGMFYFIKSDAIKKQKTLVPDKTKGFIVNEQEVQDIDTLDDWKIAELKYKILTGKKNG
jgi:N-acylneuraminate cytidylyltransferase